MDKICSWDNKVSSSNVIKPMSAFYVECNRSVMCRVNTMIEVGSIVVERVAHMQTYTGSHQCHSL